MPPVQHRITKLKGGLDLITPSLSLDPSFCTYSVNYECSLQGGYARVKGYERADGRTAPSSGTYTIVQVNGFSSTPAIGTTLTQATSGATGVIAAYGSNYLVLTKVTGTFDATHNINNGGTLVGTAVTVTAVLTALQRAQYLNAVADIYRADIGKVGGASCSGSVLGVFVLADTLYAFRNNSAGTAATLWKATTSGWTQITLPKVLSFTTGSVATPSDGQVITGGTSGKTATVRRVMLQTGAWTGTGAGLIYYTNLAGAANFTPGETITFATSGATAVTTTAGADVTLLPDGKYEVTQGNFFGQAGTLRSYGTDGVNKLFEFDGTYFCPIPTGATNDRPRHIAVHRDFLMVSVDGSVFYCEAGEPYRWATGGEIATGDIVSGLLPQPGSQATGTLAVFCRNTIFMLYGTDEATFNFVPFNVGSGGIDYTMQNFSNTFYFNREGVVSFQTTLNFGNFESSTITSRISPFINNERSKINCSTLSRYKNQYRVFFSDGYSLFITLVNDKVMGCMPVFTPMVANVAYECELTTGDEAIYVGATDGYVYQLEKGTSFDGDPINAMLVLNWDPADSPRMLKNYKRASIEMRSDTYAAIQFSYQLGYGSSEIDVSDALNLESFTQGFALWDVFTWDDFYWDGQNLSPSEADMTGTGENVQIAISSSTDYIDSYILNSVITHYIQRRALR